MNNLKETYKSLFKGQTAELKRALFIYEISHALKNDFTSEKADALFEALKEVIIEEYIESQEKN